MIDAIKNIHFVSLCVAAVALGGCADLGHTSLFASSDEGRDYTREGTFYSSPYYFPRQAFRDHRSHYHDRSWEWPGHFSGRGTHQSSGGGSFSGGKTDAMSRSMQEQLNRQEDVIKKHIASESKSNASSSARGSFGGGGSRSHQ